MKNLIQLLSCPELSTLATPESYGVVPIYGASGNTLEWRTIYALEIDSLQPGDLIEASAEGQVRNDTGWVVELASSLCWCDDNNKPPAPGGLGYGPMGTHFKEIGQNTWNGFNITPQMHYGKWARHGAFVVPQGVSTLWICARLRGRSTSSDGSGNAGLAVNMGQGHMTAKVFR